MHNNEIHIKALDKKVSELSDFLAHLGKGSDLQDLIKIFRRPGWTTPAELEFTTASIDVLHAQTELVARGIQRLVTSAKLVGVHEVGRDVSPDAPVVGKPKTTPRPDVNR